MRQACPQLLPQPPHRRTRQFVQQSHNRDLLGKQNKQLFAATQPPHYINHAGSYHSHSRKTKDRHASTPIRIECHIGKKRRVVLPHPRTPVQRFKSTGATGHTKVLNCPCRTHCAIVLYPYCMPNCCCMLIYCIFHVFTRAALPQT